MSVLIPDLKVGYYLWFDPKTVISFVIGDIETLQVSSFKHKIRYPIQSNIGRSLHKIPNSSGLGTNLISFISMNHEAPEIYAINPMNSTSTYIADALTGSRDLTWTSKGTILMAKDNMIYKYHPGSDKEWIPINFEAEFDIQGITRMIISPDGSKLAVVAAEHSL